MDLKPVETILKDHGKTAKDLENYYKLPRFKRMVEAATQAWNAATNAEERIKLKSLAIIEESLPEMFRRLHGANDPLSAKVELLKTLMKGAGVGAVEATGVGGAGISITINMGDDQPVQVQAQLPAQVIDLAAEDL